MAVLRPPSSIRSRYRFNPVANRYIAANGRFVSWLTVRSEMNHLVRESEQKIVDLTADLRGGMISVSTWQREMAEELKSLHMSSYALQKGGWAQMTPADYGRIGGLLQFEYRKLARFAAEMADRGRVHGGDTARARQYARAARHTYFLALRLELQQRGFDEEKSVLSPVDNCAGCIEQERIGWQRIGDMTPIGERDCLRNCQCFYYVRNASTGEQEGPF
jgi:hypothetical protein